MSSREGHKVGEVAGPPIRPPPNPRNTVNRVNFPRQAILFALRNRSPERVERAPQPMNATIRKFGYPNSLVREFEHWVVLVRPAQVTLGSLVLAAKSDAEAYSDLPDAAFAEQAAAVRAIESALGKFCGYERINYLMLMMVDRQVHFHVIPRYSGSRSWDGLDFPDAGWPGPPQLKLAIELDARRQRSMSDQLKALF